MTEFKSNDDGYTVNIGDEPFIDPHTGDPDSIQFDLWGSREHPPAVTNVQLPKLIEALNKIEGVTATYTRPKSRIPVPQGIGAVVALSSHIHLIRVQSTSDKTWIQNSGSSAGYYTDEEVSHYLNDSTEFDAEVLSEGVLR